MSARFVYWMNVSLDLKIASAPDDHGAGDWLRITESLHREFNARARTLSMSVEGRVMYEMMDPYWPDARNDDSQPGFMREYGEIWTSMPKILVSRTRTTAHHNTKIISDHAVDQLAALREEGDGLIGVGGADLATQLLKAGLLDELQLCTHPTILGTGRPLFDDQGIRLDLELIEQASFEQGVTLHRYAIR